MLPVELYLGVVAIAWGLSGGVGKGSNLYEYMEAANNNITWLLLLGSVGLSQSFLALLEWSFGRNWRLSTIYRIASGRTVVAFISVLAWCWIIKMMVDSEAWRVVVALAVMAPVTAFMQLWVFVENYKVRVATNENISTNTLVFRR